MKSKSQSLKYQGLQRVYANHQVAKSFDPCALNLKISRLDCNHCSCFNSNEGRLCYNKK